MGTNLIQNYTGTSKPQVQNAPDFNKFVLKAQENPILPLPSNGRLLRGSGGMLNSVGYDMKALKDGISGKANDHQLGKLNDLGMKLGGILIAAYLFTKRKTPLTKGMEFVGFAAFFASMEIWPRIAIHLPAKLLHGFNVGQKYQDSYGRKKPVFQDPQYIPWDLYSDKQINKIGDRLKIDKGIPNRRAVVQEKMKKIAVQSNTLWMLTSGFATPVMAALICNAAEKPLLKIQTDFKEKRADKLLENLDALPDSKSVKESAKTLDELLKANRGGIIDDKLVEQITEKIAPTLDDITKQGVKSDLKTMLMSQKRLITESQASVVLEKCKASLTGILSEKEVAEVLPSLEEMTQALDKAGVFAKELDEQGLFDAKKVFSRQVFKKATARGLDKDLVEEIQTRVMKTAKEEFSKGTISKLDDAAISKVKGVSGIMSKFITKVQALDKFARIKVGAAPETILANRYNDLSGSLVELLGITPKELAAAKQDRLLANTLFREKLEAITSDDTRYKDILSKLAKKIKNIDDTLADAGVNKYMQKVDELFDGTASKLAENSMQKTAHKLTALNVNGKGSLKNAQKTLYSNRVLDIKSTYCRLLNTLDVFRRISKADMGNDLRGIEREVKEELAELAKSTVLGGRASNFETKLPFLRNPHPSTEISDIVVKDGKVQNKFFNKTKRVDIPSDYKFYQRAMDFMFGNSTDKETVEVLKKSGLLANLQSYKKQVWEKLGGADYYLRPHHRTCGDASASSEFKFLLTGQAPDDMLSKVLKQTFNTKQWFKIFARFGGALLGVTLLAQLFFGRTKGDK